MVFLKNTVILILIFGFITCRSLSSKTEATSKENPVVIANDSLEYEIIIIDPGFTTYLNSIARPEGFYSQKYLEIKNSFYVAIWNLRANNPILYNSDIYQNKIDYDSNINYGYEVNYKLFNYFEFAQQKYRMVLR
ncbi:MAG: DUF6146 family protein [Tenacibaculum sp.]